MTDSPTDPDREGSDAAQLADLIDFVTKIIDQDDYKAQRALGYETGSRYEGQPPLWVYHARNWSPIRVRSEVETDRALIAAYSAATAGNPEGPPPEAIPGLELAIRIRARRFVNRPGYPEEWR